MHSTPRAAVIDSGPLLTIVGVEFILTASGARPDPSRILTGEAGRYMKNRTDLFDPLRKYVASYASVMTTSHVIGELQGLSSRLKLDEAAQSRFWQCADDVFRRLGLEERLVTIGQLLLDTNTSAWVGIIGPTDTGLIELARSQGAVLLTDDTRTLMRRAHELGVDCRLLEHELLV